MPKSVLILGGTGDARHLANRIVGKWGDRVRVITSFAGRTPTPRKPPGEIREGGFGGPEGLAVFLKQNAIDAMIDATHPYAAQISEHACIAASNTLIPHIIFTRPEWLAEAENRWLHVATFEAAANALSQQTSTALITTGVQNLEAFAAVRGSKLLIRVLTKPEHPVPIPDADIIVGRPPYTPDDELALFRRFGIDTLVTKNAGGAATHAKIIAARSHKARVIMIDRPALPDAITVNHADDIMAWLSDIIGTFPA